MNNKGFAISGILYAILALFLMLLLLILGNFQARRVTFDKQKTNVIDRLDGNEEKAVSIEYSFENLTVEPTKFEVSNDGLYMLEICNNNKYITGSVSLFQGTPLYIILNNDNENNTVKIQTETFRPSTILLICDNDACMDKSEENKADTGLDELSYVSMNNATCTNGVKITRTGD